MNKIKTICCKCKKLIHDGDLVNGMVSHSYCDDCGKKEIARIRKVRRISEEAVMMECSVGVQ